MSCVKNDPPLSASVIITSQVEAFLWDPRWKTVSGIAAIDLTCDVRNLTLGAGAAVAIKPALQLATARTDRPDAGAAITAGSVMTGNGVTHYQETVSSASKYYFRRGLSLRLTAGAFAQADVLLYAAWLEAGLSGPPRQYEFMPTNNTAAVSYFSLLGPVPAIGLSKFKYAAIGMDNLNNTMQCRAAGRAFNDPMARGAWTNLEAGWNTPAAGDFFFNSGELDLSGLSLGSYQFAEFAYGVRKSVDGDANSRVILNIFPALVFG